MREIEFRYFNEYHKVMINEGGRGKLESSDIIDIARRNGHALMQFTGLRDKNGVKIFEGDIVRMKWIKTEYIGEVKFINGAFSVNDCVGHFGQMYASCSEVLGNLHQHPHLLEQKK